MEEVKEGLIRNEVILNNETSVTFQTKKIFGFLEYIHVVIDKPIKLSIHQENFPELIMYEKESLPQGKHLLPIRYQAIDSIGNRINYSAEKWRLDGRLVFDIIGPKNTKINVVTVIG